MSLSDSLVHNAEIGVISAAMSNEAPLRKLEFYPIERGGTALECGQCKTRDSEFDVGAWYGDDDPDKDMPTCDDHVCGKCLVVWVAQETAQNMAFQKSGDAIAVYADEDEQED